MKAERLDDSQPAGAAAGEGKPPRVRPGGFFRAAVLGALAALVPAAGCYESDPVYGAPGDAADSDARDAAADDGADEVPAPEYAAPDYGVDEYGAPVYGIP